MMSLPALTARSRASRRIRAIAGAVLVVLGCVALVSGGVLGVQRAEAILQEVQETGMPGYLSLRSDPYEPVWKDVPPGSTVHWIVEAGLSDAPSSTLDLELRSSGPLVDAGALHAAVASCSSMFVSGAAGEAPACEDDARVIVSAQPLSAFARADDGTVFPLARLFSNEPRYVLVSLTIPEAAGSALGGGEHARIGVGFTATGESAPARTDPAPPLPGDPALALTGTDVSVLALLAGGLVATGIGIWLVRRSPAAITPEGRVS